MKTISGKNFTKLLDKKGWHLKRVNGSHYIYSHADKSEIISVPVHKNDELKIGLLKKLMTIAEIEEKEL